MQRPAPILGLAFAIIFAAGWCLTVGSVNAQQPTAAMLQARMPTRGVSKSTGVYINISDDGLGPGQFGYRQIKFAVASPTPVTGDTQITARVFLSDWNRSRNTVSAEADGQLLTGQSKTTLTVRVPQSTEWNQVWWDVWIDGVLDPTLSKTKEQPIHVGDNGISRWRNNQMLQLEPSPGPLNLFGLLAPPRLNGPGLSNSLVHAPLSDNWLDYTPLDIVSADVQFLKNTAKRQPAELAALKQWVRAGGVLWIEPVGDDWDTLRDVHPLFGWSDDVPIEPTKPEGNAPPGIHGWSFVNLHARNTAAQDDGLVQDFGATSPQQPALKPPAEVEPVFSNDWFIVRRYGWGTVAAFRGSPNSRPRGLTRNERRAASGIWLSKAWPIRHGLVPGMANNDFSNWLIPGVGLAPVVSFQVLITLFVLAIGPLNYYLLKRAGRLHLMVLTVPIAAIAITGALLGYGILSDGFATRLRALSITVLDQHQGEATTWSRLSYYAAFAPKNGLTFSADTAVYPIHPGSVESYGSSNSRTQRDIVWTDDQQHFTKGWLASRTPTQYLTVQPRTTDAALDFAINEANGKVTNGFDSAAQLILSTDQNGDWLIAEGVAPGQTKDMRRIERSEAVAALREQLSDREPRFPDGFDAVENSPLLYGQQRRNRRLYRQQNRDYAHTSADQSLLQQRWLELLGFGGGPAINLPSNSYLMISETAPLSSSPTADAVEDSSVHIVIGNW